VVGDTLYGASAVLRTAGVLRKTSKTKLAEPQPTTLSLDRNFLHAAAIEFAHPRTSKPLAFTAPLPELLISYLDKLRGE
jgi:23S rRNA pseudouridine1911/1915/1917 synthase